ncbi:N-acetylmuramoyl-L-alanine amidase [Metaclostridioides mangenotii]|uniref:N-acetylmuramoyl-L-alanine amidase n=1 Tax=Metaclostridioides mangenotii TaxID=1540 RepID=A0ABS4E7S5_9FIRM|nr:N-acetylmuramoyl-L-alanine amidase [Clostridioides mangenotii]MBP1853958.1 N-acetylmuramoyl-L-alanine amidase [Clostridioides mangenotii]
MKICISVGHSILKNGRNTSANGVVNEYEYNKKLAPFVVNALKKEGHSVDLLICPEILFITKDEEKTYKLKRINSKKYDLIVELHLNSYDGLSKGSEVLYNSNEGKTYADRIVKRLGVNFTNRGSKSRPGLHILNSTDCTAIIVESFFCDSYEDYKKAESLGAIGMAKIISEGILNKAIQGPGSNPGNENNKPYETVIVYNGEKDKAAALQEYIKHSSVVDVYGEEVN